MGSSEARTPHGKYLTSAIEIVKSVAASFAKKITVSVADGKISDTIYGGHAYTCSVVEAMHHGFNLVEASILWRFAESDCGGSGGQPDPAGLCVSGADGGRHDSRVGGCQPNLGGKGSRGWLWPCQRPAPRSGRPLSASGKPPRKPRIQPQA